MRPRRPRDPNWPERSRPSRYADRVSTAAARDDRIVLRFLATPADTAAGGASVAAGSVMEWIDKAGYACAVGWAGAYCVTAYVGNVRHRHPIPPGSLVEVQARIIHTGRSSMHVVVTVSSADIASRRYDPATTCLLVFVAKDADGHPTPVPEWTPGSAADRALNASALARIPARIEIKRRMLEQAYTTASEAPRTTLRFPVPPGVVNFGGKAHGGTVMRWIDEAAFACATAWMGPDALGTAVAVYSGGIHFLEPVRIGDLVDVEARLIHTGERSMHLSIRVESADPREPDRRALTTQCMSVFVVPGADGSAQPVRRWRPELEEDLRLDEHARDLIERRREIVPIPASLTLDP